MAQTNKIVMETVEWSTLDHVDEVVPVNEKDDVVLEELRDVLVKHGYCERFGITLLHRHFDLGKDEVNVETTDEESRMSITCPKKLADLEESQAIQTQWRFKYDGVTAVTVCENRCFSVGSVSHNTKHVEVGR